MLTQVKQANVDAVLALAYPGDSVLYAKQAKELGLNAPFQFVAIGPSDAFFAEGRGRRVGRRRGDDRALDAARRMEGLAGVLRRLRQEVRRGPDYLELGAAVDVARDPARARSRKPGSTRRRSARSSPRTPSRRSTARSRFDGVQNVITPTAFVQMQKGKLQIVWPKSIATGAVRSRRRAGERARPGQLHVADLDTLLSGQLLFAALVTGSLYALVALGLNLVYGTMRMLNVAHGDVVMLGAYGAYWAFTLLGVSPLVAAPLVAVARRARWARAVPRPVPAPARRRRRRPRRPARGQLAAAVLRPVDHRAERRRARLHAEQPRPTRTSTEVSTSATWR